MRDRKGASPSADTLKLARRATFKRPTTLL